MRENGERGEKGVGEILFQIKSLNRHNHTKCKKKQNYKIYFGNKGVNFNIYYVIFTDDIVALLIFSDYKERDYQVWSEENRLVLSISIVESSIKE